MYTHTYIYIYTHKYTHYRPVQWSTLTHTHISHSAVWESRKRAHGSKSDCMQARAGAWVRKRERDKHPTTSTVLSQKHRVDTQNEQSSRVWLRVCDMSNKFYIRCMSAISDLNAMATCSARCPPRAGAEESNCRHAHKHRQDEHNKTHIMIKRREQPEWG